MPQKKDRFAHVGTPEETKVISSSPTTNEFEVPYEETVQLNVNVSPALRKAIRAKALELDVPVSVAIRRVLQAWVAEK